MRHLKHRHTLGLTKAHRSARLANLALSLFEHNRIQTTLTNAKALRPFAEKIITKAKQAYNAPGPVALHKRRFVIAVLGLGRHQETVTRKLFGEIANAVRDRPGGYTRIYKLATRRQGDAAEMAIIEVINEPCHPKRRPHVSSPGKATQLPVTRPVSKNGGTLYNEASQTQSRQMNTARDTSSDEYVRRAYPIPTIQLSPDSRDPIRAEKEFEIAVVFDRAYRQVPASFIKRRGDPVTVKVGVAIELPETLNLADSLYKEIPFSEDGTQEKITFKVTPVEEGLFEAKLHLFDNNRYIGTQKLPIQVGC